MKSLPLRNLAAGIVWAALGVAVILPFLFWGTEKASEFFGAFTAAIVAAVAVIAGTYYQAELTRRRDNALLERDRIAEATDLFLWLEHAVDEMEFIARLLGRFRDNMSKNADAKLDIPPDQYREVVSAQFMGEIRDRAKMAARLSPELGLSVTPILYGTFRAVDRVYQFRGASNNFQPAREQIEQHLFITNHRVEKLRDAQIAVGVFLAEKGVPLDAFDN
jgi:hypothetical protein